MAELKIFSKRETLIWCICLGLAGFGIVAAYVMATSKGTIDAEVQAMHDLESHRAAQQP